MTWTCPSIDKLYAAIDATWPAAEVIGDGPFAIRRGEGGGKRVSAATLEDNSASDLEISAAAGKMRAMDQPALFMLRDGDDELDQKLEKLGYTVIDPVTLFVCPTELAAAHDPKGLTAIRTTEPMAVLAEIWAEGGITESRLNVMRRVAGAKTCILGRADDQPSGAAFVACDGDIAVLHALEVLENSRRKGLGLQMTGAAAAWAQEQGAKTFALLVVTENEAACNLYRKLGMIEAGKYHYRIKE